MTLIDFERCVGSLNFDGVQTDVACEIELSNAGEISLRFEPIPLTQQTRQLLTSALNHESLLVRHFALTLVSPVGATLFSETVYFTKVGTSSGEHGSVLDVGARAQRVLVEWSRDSAEAASGGSLQAAYHTVGLRGFGTQSMRFDDVTVKILGVAEISDYSEIAGMVLAEESDVEPSSLNERLLDWDHRISDLLLVLSLAQGRFVSWSIREVWYNNTRLSMELRGGRDSAAPYEPMFHYLNLERAVDLATRYDRAGASETGVDVAIEWIVMSHQYSESRYLAAMTALEHLVSKHSQIFTSLLGRRDFGIVKGAVEGRLGSAELLNELGVDGSGSSGGRDASVRLALSQISTRFAGLNSITLSDKVEQLLRTYGVEVDDIPLNVRQLVGIRNEIVHRGLHRRADWSLIEAVTTLREIVKRLVLAILEYEGPYLSYLNGPQQRLFARSREASGASERVSD